MAQRFVNGAEEVTEMLQVLPKAVASRIGRKATREVAKGVLELARRYVPVEYGDLEDSLTVRSAATTTKKRGVIGASVQTREGMYQGDEFYGGFMEFGFTQRDGVWNEGQPFLRPALYENREGKMRTFEHVAKNELEPAVQEAKKKTKARRAAQKRFFGK